MIDILFDDEIIQENYRLQLETMAEERGRAQGVHDVLNDLVAKGIITKEVAEQMLKERKK